MFKHVFLTGPPGKTLHTMSPVLLRVKTRLDTHQSVSCVSLLTRALVVIASLFELFLFKKNLYAIPSTRHIY